MQVQPAAVVPEPLPLADDVRGRGGGESVDVGPALQPGLVPRHDAADLRLLEHHLGDEDRVRVARPAPRQIGAVRGKPGEEPGVHAHESTIWSMASHAAERALGRGRSAGAAAGGVGGRRLRERLSARPLPVPAGGGAAVVARAARPRGRHRTRRRGRGRAPRVRGPPPGVARAAVHAPERLGARCRLAAARRGGRARPRPRLISGAGSGCSRRTSGRGRSTSAAVGGSTARRESSPSRRTRSTSATRSTSRVAR